jgi:hypothetical protein
MCGSLVLSRASIDAKAPIQDVAMIKAAVKSAVAAYAHAIGNEWQPYIGSNDGVQQVARGAAAAQMAAFS